VEPGVRLHHGVGGSGREGQHRPDLLPDGRELGVQDRDEAAAGDVVALADQDQTADLLPRLGGVREGVEVLSRACRLSSAIAAVRALAAHRRPPNVIREVAAVA
jgi:hypothetical protein